MLKVALCEKFKIQKDFMSFLTFDPESRLELAL